MAQSAASRSKTGKAVLPGNPRKSELRDGMQVDWDVSIPARDGLVLKADVFRPPTKGKYPVIMTYGPYGKGLSFQRGYKTAWEMDQIPHKELEHQLSDKISMCNYYANRLVCEAADRAMQVHGGIGYSRHKPFEHIYRHHRRYRITEGAEEIQMRRVAGYMFGFMDQRAPKGVTE